MSPQASQEQRDEWNDGGEVSDQKAIEFLLARGFSATRDFQWVAPAGHTPDAKESSAIGYLIDEWDWGWLIS